MITGNEQKKAHISFKELILRVQVLNNLLVLFIVTLLFLTFVFRILTNEAQEKIKSTMKILSHNLEATLEFEDNTTADEILRSLKIDHNYLSGLLLTKDHKIFASFGAYQSDTIANLTNETLMERFQISRLDYIEYYYTINKEGSPLGYVYVKYDLSQIKNSIKNIIIVSIFIMLLVLIVSIAISRPFQAKIVKPIYRLIEKVKLVTQSGDYSTRIGQFGDESNEISELYALSSVFNEMMEVVEQRNLQIKGINDTLELKVKQRTEELEKIQKIAVENAHEAGKAEVATGVLHNIGNVTNSLNISVNRMAELQSNSAIEILDKIFGLMISHKENLGEYLLNDPQGKKIVDNLGDIMEFARNQEAQIDQEVERIKQVCSLIKDAVVAQQNFAKNIRFSEKLDIKSLVEEAIKICNNSGFLKGIDLHIGFVENFIVEVEKSKFVHIILNLLKNASDAMKHLDPRDRKLYIEANSSIERGNYLLIKDSGVGIQKELLHKVFTHGFTTKSSGHGFGLHHSVIAINEMGGSLQAFSDGKDKGAEFILSFKKAA